MKGAISWTFYTSTLDLSQFRPVYAPKDFLEVIIGLQNPNYHGSDTPGYVIYKGSLAQPSSGTSNILVSLCLNLSVWGFIRYALHGHKL